MLELINLKEDTECYRFGLKNEVSCISRIEGVKVFKKVLLLKPRDMGSEAWTMLKKTLSFDSLKLILKLFRRAGYHNIPLLNEVFGESI